MSPLREAFVLPCLFLTVVLLGGLRLGQPVQLLPPPLLSLVLAMLLLGALTRSRVLVPERLMSQRRTAAENLSGLVVLLTLFGASAQVFNLVTPDTGLLHLLVSVFFLVQLLTTLAAARDRLPMLRSLVVLLACAFVLRFLALESLYSPGRGLLKRVMTALMEGVTLGALEYEPVGAATGYVAFLVLTLYVIGLVMAGAEPEGAEHSGLPVKYENGAGTSALLMLLLLLTSACRSHGGNPAGSAEARSSSNPSLRDVSRLASTGGAGGLGAIGRQPAGAGGISDERGGVVPVRPRASGRHDGQVAGGCKDETAKRRQHAPVKQRHTYQHSGSLTRQHTGAQAPWHFAIDPASSRARRAARRPDPASASTTGVRPPPARRRRC